MEGHVSVIFVVTARRRASRVVSVFRVHLGRLGDETGQSEGGIKKFLRTGGGGTVGPSSLSRNSSSSAGGRKGTWEDYQCREIVFPSLGQPNPGWLRLYRLFLLFRFLRTCLFKPLFSLIRCSLSLSLPTPRSISMSLSFPYLSFGLSSSPHVSLPLTHAPTNTTAHNCKASIIHS